MKNIKNSVLLFLLVAMGSNFASAQKKSKTVAKKAATAVAACMDLLPIAKQICRPSINLLPHRKVVPGWPMATLFLHPGEKVEMAPQLIEVTKEKKVVWVLWDWKSIGDATALQALDDPGIPEIPGQSEH